MYSAKTAEPIAMLFEGMAVERPRNYVLDWGRSFVLCGQRSSLLWTPALRPF